jgi:ubiquinone/menaquinone biosynthesis C-methylase UbiE
LAKEGVSVLGLDISYEAVAKSQLLFKGEKLPGLFIQADFLNIPLKNNSVGLIYWGLSIEYVKDTQKAIYEAYRVLKPKGRIVVPFPVVSLSTLFYHQFRGGDIPRVPILQELMELIHVKILKGKYMHYGYGQTFTIRSIRKMFVNAGFRVKNIDFFDTHYPISSFPRLVRPALRKLLRFRLFWPFAYIEAVK